MEYKLLITCEHAGNQIPQKYQSHFEQAFNVLNSHEGWDPGAWDAANYLSNALDCKLFGCHTSRLLVETNRSLNSPNLFSRYTIPLSEVDKKSIIDEFYLPYRQKVESEISQTKKPVLHLSIHTFTPKLNSEERRVDIGLLFDPGRENESKFSQAYQKNLKELLPSFHIGLNEPYLGIDDGFTTHLRGIYSDTEYLGIEVEINQKFIPDLNNMTQKLLSGLRLVLVD